MRFIAATLLFVMPIIAAGQTSIPSTTDADIAFEVASIKEAGGTPGGSRLSSPDRFRHPRISLLELIGEAYSLQRFRIIGGGGWIASTLFEVEAKAPFEPSGEQMKGMLRRLMTERFRLRTHVETREMPFYALTVAREDKRLGSQFNHTTTDCPTIAAERQRRGESPPRIPSRPGEAPLCTTFIYQRVSLGGTPVLRYRTSGTSMGQFADWLASPTGGTVIDHTGLTGGFDIDLEFAGGGIATRASADDTPSVFTAVQEQLGLQLKSQRGPVEVLVIDAAERPTLN